MGTPAMVTITQDRHKLMFYRHWDGNFETTGEDLKRFVSLYSTEALRLSLSQSAGWLIMRGHFEYKPHPSHIPEGIDMDSWKVGAYEPTPYRIDCAYQYVIDLDARELRMSDGDKHLTLKF